MSAETTTADCWCDWCNLTDTPCQASKAHDLAACGHPVADRQDLHWSDQLEDEVCPDCCDECDQ